MGYQYRAATENDLEGLMQVGLKSYGQFKNNLTIENWYKLKSYLEDENNYITLLSKSKCFVCSKEDRIVGMAFIFNSGNPTEIFQSDWSYLRMVGVNPEEAGNGIGKKLTHMCLAYAKETGEKIMALHTSEIMDAARHIYENMGFRKTKEIPDHLGIKYWIYTLHLR